MDESAPKIRPDAAASDPSSPPAPESSEDLSVRGNIPTASSSESLFERLRRRKASFQRRLEYRRLRRIRRRSVPAYIHCKNCGTKLEGMYCHRCGQYALDIEQPFWKYVRQYFENVYQFDSKIWQTLYLLFRRPGFLTQEFNAGKINSYVHPFRLYMFVSVVFFTAFFMIAASRVDALKQSAFGTLSDTVLEQMLHGNLRRDTTVYLYDARGLMRTLASRGIAVDSLFRAVPLEGMRGLVQVEMPRLVLDSCLYPTTLRDRDRLVLERLREADDSLQHDSVQLESRQLAVRAFRPGKTEVYDWREKRNEDMQLRIDYFTNSVMAQLSKWTPLFMLLMLPVFALLLKLTHRKKRQPFMHHLAHAIHINTLFLLLLTVPLGILVTKDIESLENVRPSLTLFSVFLVCVLGYMCASFHRVYGNGWLKTAYKTGVVFCIFTLLSLCCASVALLWLVMRMAVSL